MPPVASSPLGSLFKTSSGGTPLKARQEYYIGGEVPWLLSGEVAQGEIWATTNFITLAGLQNSSAKIFPKDTVVVAMYGATAGEVGILRFEAATNQAVCGIFPNDQYLPEYLYYLLLSKKDELVGKAAGNAQPNISQAKIRETLVPRTDRAEQSRIVAVLDEAFEGIATAKANAEKNLQNAREMFESALDAALSRHDVGYAATTLGEEIELLAGYAFSSKAYIDAAKGIRLLRGDNIMQGYLRWDDAKGWPATDVAPYARFALQEGDVVLAMDRPWVKAGLKRAQIGADDLPCLQVQRTARLRPRQRMSVQFLYHLTGSKAFSRHLLSVQTGIGVPHISGKQIESFQFMLPPPTEQETIAVALGELQQRSERLEEIYRQKLTALDELKKSLLHQAFSGALRA
jgi:type I restriction enzyme S subunit